MFGNLYKIWFSTEVVAFITSFSEDSAIAKYLSLGGKHANATAERLTFGYPIDHNTIYA